MEKFRYKYLVRRMYEEKATQEIYYTHDNPEEFSNSLTHQKVSRQLPKKVEIYELIKTYESI